MAGIRLSDTVLKKSQFFLYLKKKLGWVDALDSGEPSVIKDLQGVKLMWQKPRTEGVLSTVKSVEARIWSSLFIEKKQIISVWK